MRARCWILGTVLLAGCASGSGREPSGIRGKESRVGQRASSLPFDPATADGGMTAAGTYRIAYRTDPREVPEGEIFSLEVLVLDGGLERPAGSTTVEVDARMPDHGHGMVTVPRVERRGEGHFLVDGMMFQMPGLWELTVDVVEDGVAERATFAIELE